MLPQRFASQQDIDAAYDPLRRVRLDLESAQLAERSEQARRELPHQFGLARPLARRDAQTTGPQPKLFCDETRQRVTDADSF